MADLRGVRLIREDTSASEDMDALKRLRPAVRAGAGAIEVRPGQGDDYRAALDDVLGKYGSLDAFAQAAGVPTNAPARERASAPTPVPPDNTGDFDTADRLMPSSAPPPVAEPAAPQRASAAYQIPVTPRRMWSFDAAQAEPQPPAVQMRQPPPTPQRMPVPTTFAPDMVEPEPTPEPIATPRFAERPALQQVSSVTPMDVPGGFEELERGERYNSFFPETPKPMDVPGGFEELERDEAASAPPPLPKKEPRLPKGFRVVEGAAPVKRAKALGNAFWDQPNPDMLEPGNIDLTKRPSVPTGDGRFASVRTAGFNFGGKEYNLPTVSDDGRLLSNDEAIAQFRKTGKHLGVYRTPEAAAAAAEALHKDQEAMGMGRPKAKTETRLPKGFRVVKTETVKKPPRAAAPDEPNPWTEVPKRLFGGVAGAIAEPFIEGAKSGFRQMGEQADTLGNIVSGDAETAPLPAQAPMSPEEEALSKASVGDIVTDPSKLSRFIGQAAAGSTPFLAGAGAGALGGFAVGGPAGALVGAMLGGGGMAGAQSLADTYTQARRAGKSHDEAIDTAMVSGLASAGINAASIPAGVLNLARGPIVYAITQLVAQPGIGAADQAVQNVIAKESFDPKREIGAGVPQAMLGEALFEGPATAGGIYAATRPGAPPPAAAFPPPPPPQTSGDYPAPAVIPAAAPASGTNTRFREPIVQAAPPRDPITGEDLPPAPDGESEAKRQEAFRERAAKAGENVQAQRTRQAGGYQRAYDTQGRPLFVDDSKPNKGGHPNLTIRDTGKPAFEAAPPIPSELYGEGKEEDGNIVGEPPRASDDLEASTEELRQRTGDDPARLVERHLGVDEKTFSGLPGDAKERLVAAAQKLATATRPSPDVLRSSDEAGRPGEAPMAPADRPLAEGATTPAQPPQPGLRMQGRDQPTDLDVELGPTVADKESVERGPQRPYTRTAAGGSERPFKARDTAGATDEQVAGFEQRARATTDEQRQQRMDDLLREWAKRAAEEEERAKAKESSGRAEDQEATEEYEESEFSRTPVKPDKDGRFKVDKFGYVLSDKGTPIQFPDNKAAARWMVDHGQNSPDQIFDRAPHPVGKKTVRKKDKNGRVMSTSQVSTITIRQVGTSQQQRTGEAKAPPPPPKPGKRPPKTGTFETPPFEKSRDNPNAPAVAGMPPTEPPPVPPKGGPPPKGKPGKKAPPKPAPTPPKGFTLTPPPAPKAKPAPAPKAPPRPRNIIDRIKAAGGIKPTGDTKGLERRFPGIINKDGVGADVMAADLAAEGFFTEMPETWQEDQAAAQRPGAAAGKDWTPALMKALGDHAKAMGEGRLESGQFDPEDQHLVAAWAEHVRGLHEKATDDTQADNVNAETYDEITELEREFSAEEWAARDDRAEAPRDDIPFEPAPARAKGAAVPPVGQEEAGGPGGVVRPGEDAERAAGNAEQDRQGDRDGEGRGDGGAAQNPVEPVSVTEDMGMGVPNAVYAVFWEDPAGDRDPSYAQFAVGKDGKLHLATMNAESREGPRGRQILDWLKRTYNRPIVVHEPSLEANEYWFQMQDEGRIAEVDENQFTGKTAPAQPIAKTPTTEKVTVYDENDQPVQADQFVVPGAERSGVGAKRAAEKESLDAAKTAQAKTTFNQKKRESKMRPTAPQKEATDGLFGDGRGAQPDLLLTPKTAPTVAPKRDDAPDGQQPKKADGANDKGAGQAVGPVPEHEQSATKGAVKRVHAEAEKHGIDVDSQAFKDWSKKVTGESHLDKMTRDQLARVMNMMGRTEAVPGGFPLAPKTSSLFEPMRAPELMSDDDLVSELKRMGRETDALNKDLERAGRGGEDFAVTRRSDDAFGKRARAIHDRMFGLKSERDDRFNEKNFQALRKNEPELTREAYEKRRAAGRAFAKGFIGSRSNPAPGTVAGLKQASAQVDPDPTPAQKDAGNYAHGHVEWNGLGYSMETPIGGTRTSKEQDADGKPKWTAKLPDGVSYGFFQNTEGADGEGVDVFMGPNPESDTVWVIDQQHVNSQAFDEHKIMAGFDSRVEAVKAYKASFSDHKGWARIKGVTEMTIAKLKASLGAMWQKKPVYKGKPGERGSVNLFGPRTPTGKLKKEPGTTPRYAGQSEVDSGKLKSIGKREVGGMDYHLLVDRDHTAAAWTMMRLNEKGHTVGWRAVMKDAAERLGLWPIRMRLPEGGKAGERGYIVLPTSEEIKAAAAKFKAAVKAKVASLGPELAAVKGGPLKKLADRYTIVAQKLITEPFYNWVGYRYDALGNMPWKKDYRTKRRLTLGKIANIDEEINDIYESLRGADAETKDKILHYLTTKNASPNYIPEEFRPAAIAAKKRILGIGRVMLERGWISQKTHDKYAGSYLPRIYLKYLLSDEGQRMMASGGNKASLQGYLKERDESLSEEVRMLILGEITDPAFLSSFAIGQPMRDIAILDFLTEISKNKDWALPSSFVQWQGKTVSAVWLKGESKRMAEAAAYFEDSIGDNAVSQREGMLEMARKAGAVADRALDNQKRIPDDYRQVPDTQRYGMLRGMWIRKEIYNDLVGSGRLLPKDSHVFESMLGVGGAGTKINQVWKTLKVPLNPASQARNFMSNAMLISLFGDVRVDQVPVRVVQAIKDMMNNGEAYRIFKKYGGRATTFSSSELTTIHKELLDLKVREGGAWQRMHKLADILANLEKAKNIGKRAAASVGSFAGSSYALSEAIFKTAIIIDQMKKGASEADAVEVANDAVFDYSLVPQGIRYLRNAPIGAPFISWSYFTARKAIQTAIEKPWKYAPWVAIPWALTDLLIQITRDVDDDDLENLYKALPQWVEERGHAYLLPFKDAYGRWQAVDLGYIFPWTAIKQTLVHFGHGEFASALSSLGLLEGPFADLLTMIKDKDHKDPFTGLKVVDDADPPAKRLRDFMTYIWGMAAPHWLTNKGTAGDLWESAFGTGRTPGGEETKTPWQKAGRLFGINVYGIKPEDTRQRNLDAMQRLIDDATTKRRRINRDQSISEAERTKRIDEQQAYIIKLMDDKLKYADESAIHPRLSSP